MATRAEYHDAVRAFIKSQKPAMKLALNHLEEIAGFVKVMGVYPRTK